MAIALANRYARALADVVARTGNYREVLSELENFAAVYRQSAALRELFETPAVGLPAKTSVLDAILARLGAATAARNFLRVVLSNYRMRQLEEIGQAFRRVANARMGIVEVKVISAAQLSESERERIRVRFEGLTRKRVEVAFQLDPALLGGIRAQVDSTVYDGTVRGRLERLRQQFLAG